MRRSLIVFLLALLLTGGGAAGAFAAVGNTCDEVILTPTVIAGDESAARGLTVELHSRLNNQLYWDTAHLVGSEPDTRFSFYPDRRQYPDTRRYFGVSIMTYDNVSTSGSDLTDPDTELFGYDSIYADVASRTDAGTEHSETVDLRDYMDYYPLSVSIDLPGSTYVWKNAGVDVEQSGGDDMGAINMAVADYFRIPITDEQPVRFHVEKDAAGKVFSWGSDTDREIYSAFGDGAVTDNACVFYLSNAYGDGKTVDFSQVPGGYGLYRLPYETDGSTTRIDVDALEMVYPLAEDESVITLLASENGMYLLLVTTDGEDETLTVLDADTVQPVQTIHLAADGHMYRLCDGGDFLALMYDIGFEVYTEAPVGYEKAFGGVLPDIDDSGNFNYNGVMDYSGGKLAIMGETMAEGEYGRYLCGYRLMVFDETGLLYHGTYKSSLDDFPALDNDNGIRCQPDYNSSLTLGWMD